jgi:hypothetical protein
MKDKLNNKSNQDQQGKSNSNQFFKSFKDSEKQRGISNSGGQMSYQTDNKQSTVNKGNENPNVQGKKHAPKVQSAHGPKKG